MENVAQETEKAISGAIKVDEKEIRDCNAPLLSRAALHITGKKLKLFA